MRRKRTGHLSPGPALSKRNFRRDRTPRHAASPTRAGKGSSRKARAKLRKISKPQINQGVAHISLVFREMWETQLSPRNSFPSSALHPQADSLAPARREIPRGIVVLGMSLRAHDTF